MNAVRKSSTARLSAKLKQLIASTLSRSVRLGLAVAICLVACLGLTSCGEFFTAVNNNPITGTSSFVYVTNAGGTLAEYSLKAGVLTLLGSTPVTLPVVPTSIVVAPNNAFLYIGTGTGVFLYTIASDGSLTEGNNDTVAYLNPNGLAVQSMVIDSTSSWLIMTYQNSAFVDALPLSPTTGLPAAATPFEASVKAASANPQVAISPAGDNVFVTMGSNGTEIIGFTAKNTTNPGPWATSGTTLPIVTANGVDTAVAVDINSTYLFVTESNTDTTPTAGSLRMIKIASPGTDLADYPTGIGPSAVLADLSGLYVYVTNRTDGTLLGYSLDTTAQTLTNIGVTFPTEASPVALVEDSSKAYLIDVGNGANPNLWLYSFDTTVPGSLDVGSTKSTAATSPSLANGIAVTH